MKLVAKTARMLKYLLWSLEVPLNYTDKQNIFSRRLGIYPGRSWNISNYRGYTGI